MRVNVFLYSLDCNADYERANGYEIESLIVSGLSFELLQLQGRVILLGNMQNFLISVFSGVWQNI